ncbi:hypothetical protein [Salininema proteolyticum]|uniref:Uncharacterized protein n=1 Tax=Salininema proteolyticum TaxID=1607685 RepID=A0ABV8TWZ9_9ACTN
MATIEKATETVARWQGREYEARVLADGAAYELISPVPQEGFRPSAGRFRRYVHVKDTVTEPYVPHPDTPICLPVDSGLDQARIQNLTQRAGLTPREADIVTHVRNTARVRRGTRMVKPLSAQQVSRQLHSPPTIGGVCYREYDTAHLRLPEHRQALSGDPDVAATVAFALRWNAVDAGDYVPTDLRHFPGLPTMSSRERRGTLVIGSGFLPSPSELIPEFATARLADIPLTSGAEILAYTPEGEEVLLFQYQAGTRTWERMAGARRKNLLDQVPGNQGNRTRYFVEPSRWSGLVALHEDRTVTATADLGFGRGKFGDDVFVTFLPGSTTPTVVSSPQRFYITGWWKGVECLAVDHSDEWVRLRLTQPSMEDFSNLNVSAVERGLYETWVRGDDIQDFRTTAVRY